ncbi:MAG: hypothetical protein HC896_08880 [Bacteroidales bacterium]|nr:hypothetical protein [Bacteroidales bacterium]
MNNWWLTMPTQEKVFWLIALPSTIVFLFQLFLTFAGGDTDDAAGSHECQL